MNDVHPMCEHDAIRGRLLARAGIFPQRPPAPPLDEIYKMQWSRQFENAMRNRMAMGYFRYGALPAQVGRHNYDNVGSIKKRLALYEADKNREHLVDIANLCLVEFAVHPELPFVAADDGEHVGELKTKGKFYGV